MPDKLDEIKQRLKDYISSLGHVSLSWQEVAKKRLLDNAADDLSVLLPIVEDLVEVEPLLIGVLNAWQKREGTVATENTPEQQAKTDHWTDVIADLKMRLGELKK